MHLDSNIIDATVVGAMVFMSISVTLLALTFVSVLVKSMDTLGSIQRLCNTIDQEVGPTAVQLREVMEGVNQLKGVATSRITAVGSQVEHVAGNLGTAVEQAQKQSSVFGTGLLAGIKSYLNSPRPQREASPGKQITMDKGEQHE